MLLVGTSGPLGRYIELSPAMTIAARALLAFGILWAYCRYKGFSMHIAKEHRIVVIISGVLMGAHWVTYFKALQLSNVAIGMLSLFTYPIMTAFLEPVMLKTKFEPTHILLGLLVLLGVYLLVPDFNLSNSQTWAVAIGLFSAILYALRNIILKRRVSEYHGSSLMTWQMGIIAVVLSPIFFSPEIVTLPDQLPWILVLALLTTAMGHTLFLMCFRYFSITSISILSCVQPIYGILLGALFLGEIPRPMTMIGGALILVAVGIEGFRSKSKI